MPEAQHAATRQGVERFRFEPANRGKDDPNASPLGGNYQWSGPSHNIVLRGSSASDAIMQRVDVILDDGDLSTGDFQKTAAIGFHLLVH